MPLDDRWIPAHQEWRYVCDASGCEIFYRVPGPETAHRPPGFYLELTRVTEARKHSKAPQTLFFHDKGCLLQAMQYQNSALTSEPITPPPPKES